MGRAISFLVRQHDKDIYSFPDVSGKGCLFKINQSQLVFVVSVLDLRTLLCLTLVLCCLSNMKTLLFFQELLDNIVSTASEQVGIPDEFAKVDVARDVKCPSAEEWRAELDLRGLRIILHRLQHCD